MVPTGLKLVLESSLISHNFYEPIAHALNLAGVPDQCMPSRLSVTIICAIIVLVLFLCVSQWRRRSHLSRRLKEAEARLEYLNEKLFSRGIPKKEVRIFMDGAFDLLHYGHMNAFRLARSLGTHLVVGINSDESITECKGPPLMNDHERLTMVSACKFVDEVVPGCPYVMNKQYLDHVIEKYKIDYVVHGDDPCFVDGKDVYEAAKQAGKFQTIPRTEGVSTTDIVGRMLLMSKEHHFDTGSADYSSHRGHKSSDAASMEVLLSQQSKFLTTSRMLQLFSAGVKAPTKDMRVVYIDGAWDLFHPGHVAILKAARERGDYLIVGVHGDATVNRVRGMNLPLMNLHERVLSVLGCRFVDDVLIDAPYEISEDMISSLHIDEVVRGNATGELGYHRETDSRYRYAKDLGIMVELDMPNDFSVMSIVQRIQRNHETFQAKFERKSKTEKDFYKDKYTHANGSSR